MAVREATGLDTAAQANLSFLQAVLGGQPRDFAVRLWDGTTWEPDTGRPARFTLVLKHGGAVRNMFWPPDELTLGEAFIYDDYDIEGDLQAVFPLVDEIFSEQRGGIAGKLQQARRLLTLPSGQRARDARHGAYLHGAEHSLERDRQAVSYHYDQSNEFFAQFLDSRMVYSCAYFASPDEGLEAAQARKLDYICRKLRLQPGERLLDIGCGWGGMLMHAAANYGVDATGVTLSRRQAQFARERIANAGLEDRCHVELRDYREVDGPGRFDKLVSIGMVEHLGESQLPTYFRQAFHLLRPGGAFFNHGISRAVDQPRQRGRSFVDKYVWPDAGLETISTMLRAAEGAGFEVRDVENLREHYVLTLRQWVRRLEASHAEAVAATDETTYRIWRLYMSGSAHAFQTGQLGLHQTLLVKDDHGASGLPLTRADWYAGT